MNSTDGEAAPDRKDYNACRRRAIYGNVRRWEHHADFVLFGQLDQLPARERRQLNLAWDRLKCH